MKQNHRTLSWCVFVCILVAWVSASDANAATYRVTPDAAGGGDGLSWTSDGSGSAPMTLSEAVVAAASGDVLLLKHGTYALSSAISISKSVTMRGGYAGTDDSTLFSGDASSVLDGGASVVALVTLADSTAGGGSIFERLRFEHASKNGFVKTGSADISFLSCAFSANGAAAATKVNGNGLSVTGAADTQVVISNCTFAGNLPSTDGRCGTGCYVSTAARVVVEDSLFVSNGVPLAANPVNDYKPAGVALYVKDAVAEVRRCEFRANRGTGQTVTAGGGIVALVGSCGGSSLVNCLWTGNTIPTASSYHAGTMNNSTYNNGMLFVRLSTHDDTIGITNCTFAYNHAYTARSPVGLNVYSGTVSLANSIFYGNITGYNVSMPKDIYVQSGAEVRCSYSLFEATNSTCLAAADGGTIAFGEGMAEGNPEFASPPTSLSSMIKVYNSNDGYKYTYPDPAKSIPALAEFDCHVTNSVSPAVDAGDPGSDYSREPSPNGLRVNLGAYGNTSGARISSGVQPTIVDDRVDVTFPYGTTQPRISFAVGSETPGEMKATVEISYSTNGLGYVEWSHLSNVAAGYAHDEVLPLAFCQGDVLRVRVIVSASGMRSVLVETSAPLVNPMPESYGRGGGEGVLHVRAGATGRGTGSDWFNAVSDVSRLSGTLLAGVAEVWVAGSNVCAGARTALVVGSDVVFRGGFAGLERSLAERPAQGRSVIDGGGAFEAFSIENAAGTEAAFERLSFMHSSSSGLLKTGAGDLVVRDCDFTANNESESASAHGMGLSVAAAADTQVVISNCTFAGNRATRGDDQFGVCLYVSTAARVMVEDSLFVSNGVPVDARLDFNVPRSVNNFKTCGVAMYAEDAVLDVRRCEFRANRGGGITHGNGAAQNRGGIVALRGSCGGSRFQNCIWAGNVVLSGKSFHENSYSSGTYNNGMVWMDLAAASNLVAFTNCTFAYNHANAKYSPVCLNVGMGSADVCNCIFYGNTAPSTVVYPMDVFVASGARARVDYSLFESTNETYVSSAEIDYGGGVVADAPEWGNHVVVGDPLMTDDKSSFEALFEVYVNIPTYAAMYTRPKTACWGSLSNRNVHLRGHVGYRDEKSGQWVRFPRTRSPGIDAGCPESDYSLEPSSQDGGNGRRVNLGAYGNTPYATMSAYPGLILRVR